MDSGLKENPKTDGVDTVKGTKLKQVKIQSDISGETSPEPEAITK